MHFCNDELQIILLIARDGMEHLLRYAKATTIYVCFCARCYARRIFK